jgi:hypothetical protein
MPYKLQENRYDHDSLNSEQSCHYIFLRTKAREPDSLLLQTQELVGHRFLRLHWTFKWREVHILWVIEEEGTSHLWTTKLWKSMRQAMTTWKSYVPPCNPWCIHNFIRITNAHNK